MTEMTIYEVSESPIVSAKAGSSAGTGTPRKRTQIFVRGIAASGQTIILDSYLPGLQGIEGIDYASLTGAWTPGSAATWSGKTLTFTAIGAGTVDISVVGYY